MKMKGMYAVKDNLSASLGVTKKLIMEVGGKMEVNYHLKAGDIEPDNRFTYASLWGCHSSLPQNEVFWQISKKIPWRNMTKGSQYKYIQF